MSKMTYLRSPKVFFVMQKNDPTAFDALRQFFPDLSDPSGLRPLGKGNINTSYSFFFGGKDFLLQKINPLVFSKPEQVIANIRVVYHHLLQKAPELALIELLPAQNGQMFWKDEEGAVWRSFPKIPHSYSVDHPFNKEIAFDGARMIGRFLNALQGLNDKQFYDTIPDFHNSLLRFQYFRKVVRKNKASRLHSVKKEVTFIEDQATVFRKIDSASLPRRIVHNDAKMDNVLFDTRTHKALGLIDWDTIMPGTILSDYGDMMRTLMNPVAEDSEELDRISIDLEFFNFIHEGFLEMTADMLDPIERQLLPLAPLWITLEQAMRFLTDYLEGDVYYKINYDGHNLVRVQNQLRLFKSFQNVLSESNP